MCLRETQIFLEKKIWILFDPDCTQKLITLWYKDFAAEFSNFFCYTLIIRLIPLYWVLYRLDASTRYNICRIWPPHVLMHSTGASSCEALLSQTLLGNPHRHVCTNHGQTDRHRHRHTVKRD